MYVVLNNRRVNMKTVIVFALFLAVTLASRRDEINEAVRACGGENSGPNELKNKILEKDPDTAALGKIILCVNKKIGLQNENGDIDESVLKRDLNNFVKDETKVNAIVEECGKRKGTTPEEAAFNFLKCYETKLSA